MVIRALDIVARCDTAIEGRVLGLALRKHLENGELIELSFEGVYDVPSSFINTSIVYLFKEFEPEFVRSHLSITNATKPIAEMIRRCVANGLREVPKEK